MKGYVADIETLTTENRDFRQVLYTGKHLQLVLMALKPGQSIGVETHVTHDQFFRIETGKGKALIDGVIHKVKVGDCIIVPSGAEHDLTNSGKKVLRLYTLYAPPEHLDRLVQKTRAIADAADEAFDGATSE
jgi:mannose-6-phosphate isomerase-like protein (cupin superfamily)